MPWKPPSNLRILSRLRKARAARMAKKVASEPLLAKRTLSAQAMASQMASARLMACSLLAKKVEPRSICSRTAATTSGWAWPSSMGPLPSRKSMYSLPLTSQTLPPRPSRITRSLPMLPSVPPGR